MKGNAKSYFWDKLQTDIDAIRNRAKENLKNYESSSHKIVPSKYHRHKAKTIEIKELPKEMPYQQLKRTKIYRAKRQEEQNAKTISNRLVYLSNEKSKKHQTMQLAKKKYEKIVQIRNKSFRDKEIMQERKTSYIVKSKKVKEERVKEVQSARSDRDQSLKNWLRQLETSAQKIRQQTKLNEDLVKKERMMKIQENKQKAIKARASLDHSRSQLSQASEERVKTGKLNFINGRSHELKIVEQKRKRNVSLLEKVRMETEKIQKYRSKANQKIQQYRQVLKLGPEKNKSRVTSQNLSLSSRSFYLTTS